MGMAFEMTSSKLSSLGRNPDGSSGQISCSKAPHKSKEENDNRQGGQAAEGSNDLARLHQTATAQESGKTYAADAYW